MSDWEAMWQEEVRKICFGQWLMPFRASKLRWRICDDSLEALTSEEVFFMATKGGGEFFGKVGSFEPGYEFDAVVLDDSRLAHPQELDIRSRLERMIYLADEREVVGKYVKGKEIDLS